MSEGPSRRSGRRLPNDGSAGQRTWIRTYCRRWHYLRTPIPLRRAILRGSITASWRRPCKISPQTSAGTFISDGSFLGLFRRGGCRNLEESRRAVKQRAAKRARATLGNGDEQVPAACLASQEKPAQNAIVSAFEKKQYDVENWIILRRRRNVSRCSRTPCGFRRET